MYKPKKNEELFIDPIVQFDREVPERRLYLAVILQALLDATNKTNIIAKDKAKAWFFCSVGVTCENFEFICDSANIDCNSVRGFAYEVINSKQNKNFRYRIYQVLSENK
jgi:hypothetical protein|tara:strand:- start:232 stop:558 length:327 start_codon:yes stop_codon:yes gene_type:complete